MLNACFRKPFHILCFHWDNISSLETRARIVLTADPQRSNVWSGETVRLTCKVEDSDPFIRWEYTWKKLREAKETTFNSYTGEGFSTYTLSRVIESDSAQYRCEAKTENHEIISSPHTLTVTSPPPAVLTLNPAWRKFYPTEKVTLKCEIQPRQTEWSYLWYRDGAYMKSGLSREDELTIPALDQSHRGRYSCRGGLPGRDVYTEMSKDVTLTVDALPPVVLTLQTGWTNIFNTERAALHCDIQDRSPVWMHKWYRDGQELPVSTAEDTYEILSAAQSDAGTYTCKGQHKERVLYTGISSTVALKVSGEAPKPLLTLEPPSGEIFTRDTVTLSCKAGTDPAGWEYLWFKKTRGAALTSTDSSSTDGSSYTIHSAA
ncbi:Fc receptor-like protein 5, partial [Anguilla rostrata]|uniref:Fc receptor-like protein 5 n=1 Tax=Anguilla rostrata TaxID=7938 RepID=UPI0030CCBAD1